MPNFKHNQAQFLRELAHYDSLLPAVDTMWMSAESQQQINMASSLQETITHRLQVAYYNMTDDRNSLDLCMRLDVSFMRKMAKLAADDLIAN
jgi:hypothetical protein